MIKKGNNKQETKTDNTKMTTLETVPSTLLSMIKSHGSAVSQSCAFITFKVICNQYNASHKRTITYKLAIMLFYLI